jgi:hypothetical protein
MIQLGGSTLQYLIEYGVPMKPLRLIKMCLNKIYIKVRTGKYLFDTFSTQNGLKEGDVYRHCFSTLL